MSGKHVSCLPLLERRWINMINKLKRKEKIIKSKNIEAKTAYLMIAPSILIIIGLGMFPVAYTIWLSLNKVNPGTLMTEFIGLDNYISTLSKSGFWSSIKITLYFSLVSIFVQLIIGTLIALLLNRDFFGRSVVRALILVPWAVPTIVNANLWKWIFNTNYGILNKVLLELNLIEENIVWMGNGKLALNMIIIADTWRMIPLVVIMLLAGLQTVSSDIIEAALIDGANAWQRFKVVFFPALKSMYAVTIVLRTIQTIRVFDIVYSLTGGGPNNSTQVISFYAYHEIFDYLNYGKGAAISIIIGVIVLLLSMLNLRVARTED